MDDPREGAKKFSKEQSGRNATPRDLTARELSARNMTTGGERSKGRKAIKLFDKGIRGGDLDDSSSSFES